MMGNDIEPAGPSVVKGPALSTKCGKSNLDESYEFYFKCSLERDRLLLEPNISHLVGVKLDLLLEYVLAFVHIDELIVPQNISFGTCLIIYIVLSQSSLDHG
jgi:hypothetical protein